MSRYGVGDILGTLEQQAIQGGFAGEVGQLLREALTSQTNRKQQTSTEAKIKACRPKAPISRKDRHVNACKRNATVWAKNQVTRRQLS